MEKQAPLSIYLADLRHNYSGVLSVDAMPLGVGYIQAVMSTRFTDDQISVRTFAYPDDLLSALDASPPDVLMVGNYMWNEALGHFFLRHLKRLRPHALAVMGGPNISNESERQVEYVESHPEIDVYICGEADFVASDLIELFLQSDRNVAALGACDIPSSVFRRDGTVMRSSTAPRRRSLDDIPSPFLLGYMDKYFDGKLAPMIETNRGCPFRCKFCVQGTDFYNKVNYFDLDRLRDEIQYIAKLNHERCPEMGTLRIADPNFGMYERDVDIAGIIGEMQKQYRWPTFIDATTGKNKPERIIECLEKVNGALVLYQAVQSLDDEVLRNINRSNIKISSYEQIMVHIRGRGLRSNSDLILGLPGESLDSHLRGMHQLIDAGTDQAHCFQAMVLKGSDLETIEMREKYQFLTRFRVLPKNYGIYGGEKVFDIEEIIVGTDTLPFDDYVECRKHHLAFSIFWNDSWFKDLVQLAGTFGVKPSEWLTAMLEGMKQDNGTVRQLLDEFVGETKNELFPSRDSCEEFYSRPENFERLQRAEIGDNLMYKYRAKASFFDWEATCAVAMAQTLALIKARASAADAAQLAAIWPDFCRYTQFRHASGREVDQLLKPVHANFEYDVAAWCADGFPRDTSRYHRAVPREVVFELTEEGARELEAAMRVWSAQLTGLTKLVTRIRVTSQVRHPREATTEATVGAAH